jgi:hypothetical protein
LADEARTPEEQKEYELGSDAVYVDEAPNGKENAGSAACGFLI